jgi:GxxExxY protein
MNLYKQEEYYKIVGICMEVHRVLGGGLLEIIYKEAIEIELKIHNIPYEREKEFILDYKGHKLKKRFNADFIVYDEIILEIKASKMIVDENVAQTLNYMGITKSGLGIIANFNIKSLQHKRLVL